MFESTPVIGTLVSLCIYLCVHKKAWSVSFCVHICESTCVPVYGYVLVGMSRNVLGQMFSEENFATGQLLAFSHTWSHVDTQESAQTSCRSLQLPEGRGASAVDVCVAQAWIWIISHIRASTSPLETHFLPLSSQHCRLDHCSSFVEQALASLSPSCCSLNKNYW